ncbi:NUDIX hydrolase [Paenibacillus sp. HJGM_3]|uniref:NUDIX hydrolase n=1 Tax=Paenibacillus sp. HJGM_3 TaxID=3379816 RepID=UPI00385C97EF
MKLQWLEWAKQIQAISQSGLAYSKDVYDQERFEQLRQLSIEIMSAYTGVEEEKVRSLFAAEQGYATPKVAVRAVVFREGKLLLVRERADGAWALPGGWADIGLSPKEIAVKETREESGYEVQAGRLLAIFDKNRHEDQPPSPYHEYTVYILCELIGGEERTSVETSEVGFFGPDELPVLSSSRNTENQVNMLFSYLNNPDQPAYSD